MFTNSEHGLSIADAVVKAALGCDQPSLQWLNHPLTHFLRHFYDCVTPVSFSEQIVGKPEVNLRIARDTGVDEIPAFGCGLSHFSTNFWTRSATINPLRLFR
jgi:hypothetical protein